MRRLLYIAALLAPGLAAAQETEVGVVDHTSQGRPYEVRLDLSYRMLAVVDEDPANDQLLSYDLRGTVRPFANASVFVATGVTQGFVAESGGTVRVPTTGGDGFRVDGEDSALRMQDTQVAFSYRTPVDLTAERKLGITHTLKVFLPTSRESRARDLYLAPQVIMALASEVVDGLTASTAAAFRYRFHAYAETASAEGTPITELDTSMRFGLDYLILDSAIAGTLSTSAAVVSSWSRRHDARDAHQADSADPGAWLQSWGWSWGLEYAPIRYLAVSAAVEHGMPVLRGGIVNVDFLHRDATELVFGLTGRY